LRRPLYSDLVANKVDGSLVGHDVIDAVTSHEQKFVFAWLHSQGLISLASAPSTNPIPCAPSLSCLPLLTPSAAPAAGLTGPCRCSPPATVIRVAAHACHFNGPPRRLSAPRQQVLATSVGMQAPAPPTYHDPLCFSFIGGLVVVSGKADFAAPAQHRTRIALATGCQAAGTSEAALSATALPQLPKIM